MITELGLNLGLLNQGKKFRMCATGDDDIPPPPSGPLYSSKTRLVTQTSPPQELCFLSNRKMQNIVYRATSQKNIDLKADESLEMPSLSGGTTHLV